MTTGYTASNVIVTTWYNMRFDHQEDANDSGFTVSQQHGVPSSLSAADHTTEPPLSDAPDSSWVPKDFVQSAEDSTFQSLPQQSQQQGGSFETASSPNRTQQTESQHVEPSALPAEALQRSQSLATLETAEQAALERQPALARSVLLPLQGGISSRSTRPKVRILPCPGAFVSASVSGRKLVSGDQWHNYLCLDLRNRRQLKASLLTAGHAKRIPPSFPLCFLGKLAR